ncbi:CHAT domain-containing protein [Rathayibacter oskolensis]|uniref:CHAT domain-containing protein n=1 Tax=Rathayibacter oskolensis TaxID=1891671 RepID=A0A1X7NFY8_9MICO|nr:CHAT domain-containing protein [Rathayibacter oskolensis]SMH35967.1 CHAT domain-containing protein [Rathayibacter oskolensis]
METFFRTLVESSGPPVHFVPLELLTRSDDADEVVAAFGAQSTVVGRRESGIPGLIVLDVPDDAVAARGVLPERLRTLVALNHVAEAPRTTIDDVLGVSVIAHSPSGSRWLTEVETVRLLLEAFESGRNVLSVPLRFSSLEEPIAFRVLGELLDDPPTSGPARYIVAPAGDGGWPAASPWSVGASLFRGDDLSTVLVDDGPLDPATAVADAYQREIWADPDGAVRRLAVTRPPLLARPHDDAAPPPQTAVFPVVTLPETSLLPGEEFLVTVGLAENRPDQLAGGSITYTGRSMEIDVALAYDSDSFDLRGPAVRTMTMSPDDRYPSIDFPLTPRHDNGNPAAAGSRPLNRSIAAHFLVDHQLRAIAIREVTIGRAGIRSHQVLSTSTGGSQPIDLEPLLDEDAPDLLLTVYLGSSEGARTYMWGAFPRDESLGAPVVASAALTFDLTDIASFVAGFQTDSGQLRAISAMEGRGKLIGDAIPAAIRRAIQRIVTDSDRAPDDRPAPSILVLTDEPSIPWELAVLRGDDRIGDRRPRFLGAHAAIGRWPVPSSQRRRPVAVKTVSFTVGVSTRLEAEGWSEYRLLEGEKEVEIMATRYLPFEHVDPIDDAVTRALEELDADVLHFALHGSAEVSVEESGILIARSDPNVPGGVLPSPLTANWIRGQEFRSHPFVFVNACQLGRTSMTLGSADGIAPAFISAEASGVVGTLWDVTDSVAREISTTFYEQAEEGLTAGEILRRVRARYVADPETGVSPSATLLAYVLFGHPNLRLRRSASDSAGARR